MIFKTKKLQASIFSDLQLRYKNIPTKTLGILLQSDNPSTLKFISKKAELAKKLGVTFVALNVNEQASFSEWEDNINEVANAKIDGIIVQLPIDYNNQQQVLDLIPASKDVDCLTTKNLESFFKGKSKIMPPVVFAVYKILQELNFELKNKNVVMVGEGVLTGLPLSYYLKNNQAKVTIINQPTKNLEQITKQADLVISATGVPNLITKDHGTDNQLLIDIGGGHIDGKLVGDINKDILENQVTLVPVPGGVGPLTVLGIFENLLKL